MMAAWNIERALDTAALLEKRWPAAWDKLRQQLALDQAELHGWRQVAKGLVRGDDAQNGLIEQFAGYFGLEQIDLAAYTSRSAPMDVVLGRERNGAMH